MKGFVYIFSNKAMPGLLKIGFSRKDPKLRAKELEGTGIPYPFIVEYYSLVENPFKIEQSVHAELLLKREGKEFFKVSINEAILTIYKILISLNQKILYEDGNIEDREQIKVEIQKYKLEREKEKRKNWWLAIKSDKSFVVKNFDKKVSDLSGLILHNNFEPDLIFQILNKLKVKTGFTLDGIYLHDANGCMYARKNSDNHYHYDELDLLPEKQRTFPFLVHIKEPSYSLSDDDFLSYMILGFVELAIFFVAHEHLYCRGHGCYGKSNVVCSRQSISHMGLTEDEKKKINSFDLHPRVSIKQINNGAYVEVLLVEFKPWGCGLGMNPQCEAGFHRVLHSFFVESPYKSLNQQVIVETLMEKMPDVLF